MSVKPSTPRFVLVVLAALLGARAAAPAQEETKPARVLKLPLRECIVLSLDRNVDLEIARHQPGIEEQNILAAEGKFDHLLYSSFAGGESVSRSANPLDSSDLDTDTASSRTGLKRVLPFGMTYDLYFEVDRTLSNAFFTSSINPRWTESLGVDLSMPLLRGRGEEAQYADVVIARHGREIAAHRFEKSLTDQVAAVHQAYWDLVFALDQLEVRKQSLKAAERLLEDNRRKFEQEVLARVDVTEAEAAVAAQVEGILTAENAVQSAMDLLKRLIDPELLRRDAVVTPLDAPPTLERPLDERAAVEAALADALRRRPEYREFPLQIAGQDARVRRAENTLLPKLDLTAGGALNGVDDAFGRSNDELRSLDFRDWTVGFVFEWPIEGRAAEGELRRLELERRRLELQKRSLEDQILVEVRAAVRDVKTAEKRIEATKRARELAQERFEGEVNRQAAGLRTTFHVLDAEERLAEARTNEIKARIDYALALMSLERARGTLLDRHGIVVEEALVPRLRRP